MAMTRALSINGKILGNGKEPLICMPLVGRNEQAVLNELAAVLTKAPDLIEWRVDFFAGIEDMARTVLLAQAIRANSSGVPIIFTRRSIREGGEHIGMTEDKVLQLYQAVCRAGTVDFIDYELSSAPADFASARTLAKETGVQLIASFHHFEMTPSREDIMAKFVAMESAGADIAKVAVMPQNIKDVLVLLEATLAAQNNINLPLITISMGAYGAISRLFGWVFGSSVSFVVGQSASAPGQVPIEDLRAVLEVVQRAMRAG